MTHKSTWKAFERKVAKFLGGFRRLRHIGGKDADKDPGDVVGVEGLFVECKYREKNQVYTWWEEANVKAKETGSLPVVFVKMKKKTGALVCIEMSQFDEIIGLIQVARDQNGQDE